MPNDTHITVQQYAQEPMRGDLFMRNNSPFMLVKIGELYNIVCLAEGVTQIDSNFPKSEIFRILKQWSYEPLIECPVELTTRVRTTAS